MMSSLQSHALLFLTAWKQSLLAGIPLGMIDILGIGRRIEISGCPPFQARKIQARQWSAIEAGELSRRAIRMAYLAPAENNVLRREMVLPRTALGNLDAVVKLDIPISTPFEESEVFFAAKARPSPVHGKISVTIAMVQRDVVETALLQVEESYGARPSRLWLGPGLVVEIDARKAEKRSAALRLDILLAGLALTLGVFVYAFAIAHQDDALRREHLNISRSLAAIERVGALQHGIQVSQQRIDFLPARRAHAVLASPILARIGAYLPPEFYLLKLSIEEAEFKASFAGRDGPPSPDRLRGLGDALLNPGYALTPSPDGTFVTVSGKLLDGAGAPI